ncbi:DNA helicase UvrD [Candidatus Woesearchaeota archaeon]|nr:DNA helicase UvrD [Candidatus Woesearchaeota archaeon]
MEVIADLQIHSKYSRATSKDLSIENLEKYARIKGVNLLGTGDFQHPLHRKDIDKYLKEDKNGILWTKNKFPFIWQTEVSLMFSQGGKRRAVHLLIFSPNGKIADEITKFLGSKGRLDYDGRPIFGMSCIELVKGLKNIDDMIEIICAHSWTPWFGVFGSDSGFDSIQECFQDQTEHIYAIETGLSSDPAMNWRISKLDRYTIVSNSDSHSFWPYRLGREATIFDLKELSYENIIKAIRKRVGLSGTIEVSPFFGKYHLTGHRNCGVSFESSEAEKLNNICPKCKGKLTIGVAARVEQLADRPEGFVPENAVPFRTLIPLQEILASILKVGVLTKKVWNEYDKLISRFGSEFNVLLNISEEDLLSKVDQRIANAILLNRKGKIKVKGGYDGVYGVPIIDDSNNQHSKDINQKHLVEF